MSAIFQCCKLIMQWKHVTGVRMSWCLCGQLSIAVYLILFLINRIVEHAYTCKHFCQQQQKQRLAPLITVRMNDTFSIEGLWFSPWHRILNFKMIFTATMTKRRTAVLFVWRDVVTFLKRPNGSSGMWRWCPLSEVQQCSLRENHPKLANQTTAENRGFWD